MNEQEVIAKIGKKNWAKFDRFMCGQTIGLNKDGTLNYYECDVENFLRPKNKRFFD
jgi:hypothetical protein